MSTKYSAVITYPYSHNSQVSPWFDSAQSCGDWCDENGVKWDAIMPCSNWQEVQAAQNDPSNKYSYMPEGAWEVFGGEVHELNFIRIDYDSAGKRYMSHELEISFSYPE